MLQLGTLNIPTIAGDKISPVNGDVWYNSSTNKFRKREGGVTSDLDTTGAGGSGITRSILSISGATTGAAVASTDYVYICTATLTFTLPTAVGNTNRYTIKNTAGTTTIGTTSAQTIDAGATPITITRTNNALEFISDNANWKLI